MRDCGFQSKTSACWKIPFSPGIGEFVKNMDKTCSHSDEKAVSICNFTIDFPSIIITAQTAFVKTEALRLNVFSTRSVTKATLQVTVIPRIV